MSSKSSTRVKKKKKAAVRVIEDLDEVGEESTRIDQQQQKEEERRNQLRKEAEKSIQELTGQPIVLASSSAEASESTNGNAAANKLNEKSVENNQATTMAETTAEYAASESFAANSGSSSVPASKSVDPLPRSSASDIVHSSSSSQPISIAAPVSSSALTSAHPPASSIDSLPPSFSSTPQLSSFPATPLRSSHGKDSGPSPFASAASPIGISSPRTLMEQLAMDSDSDGDVPEQPIRPISNNLAAQFDREAANHKKPAVKAEPARVQSVSKPEQAAAPVTAEPVQQPQNDKISAPSTLPIALPLSVQTSVPAPSPEPVLDSAVPVTVTPPRQPSPVAAAKPSAEPDAAHSSRSPSPLSVPSDAVTPAASPVPDRSRPMVDSDAAPSSSPSSSPAPSTIPDPSPADYGLHVNTNTDAPADSVQVHLVPFSPAKNSFHSIYSSSDRKKAVPSSSSLNDTEASFSPGTSPDVSDDESDTPNHAPKPIKQIETNSPDPLGARRNTTSAEPPQPAAAESSASQVSKFFDDFSITLYSTQTRQSQESVIEDYFAGGESVNTTTAISPSPSFTRPRADSLPSPNSKGGFSSIPSTPLTKRGPSSRARPSPIDVAKPTNGNLAPGERISLVKTAGVGAAIDLRLTAPEPRIPKRELVAQQRFQCFGCSKLLSLSFFTTAPRYCNYTYRYYCPECHKGDERVIPARILHLGDCQKYRVCTLAAQYIDSIATLPIVPISAVHPRVYEQHKSLRYAFLMRQQLTHIRAYIYTCKQRETLLKLFGPRRYMLNDTHIVVPGGNSTQLWRAVAETSDKPVNRAEPKDKEQKASEPERANIPWGSGANSGASTPTGARTPSGGFFGSRMRQSSYSDLKPSSSMDIDASSAADSAANSDLSEEEIHPSLRDMWSLNDLIDLLTGDLTQRLHALLKTLIHHITSGKCTICSSKAFYCEYSKCPEPNQAIYPFQFSTVVECVQCHGFFHRGCYSEVDCPKCDRIRQRELGKKKAQAEAAQLIGLKGIGVRMGGKGIGVPAPGTHSRNQSGAGTAAGSGIGTPMGMSPASGSNFVPTGSWSGIGNAGGARSFTGAGLAANR